ncbi:MAG: class I SAM-dependent methyltransferase [Myxococcales bacterium]|nr:class I SAM-dependent methyltransferase [Myxococcales bacterium]MCB9627204.1 class I SAM-dependent methyltransferase [Sandaracinaceae bacterium]
MSGRRSLSAEEQAFLAEAERAFLERGSVAHYEDAPYYHRTYQHRKVDVRWYTELCAARGGSVLELGCGTGRITLPLAKAGVRLTGVDSMPPMLAEAEARLAKLPRAARERVTLRLGDLRTLSLGQSFDTIIAPFNVLMHIYSPAEMANTLARVAEHLAPGGRFVFDVLLPDPALLARNPERTYKGRAVRHPNGERYAYYESFDYDPVAQVLAITIELTNVADPSDVRVQLLTHRQYFPLELEAVLAHAGFEAEARYGDFEGEPLNAYAESQVWVCRRTDEAPGS